MWVCQHAGVGQRTGKANHVRAISGKSTYSGSVSMRADTDQIAWILYLHDLGSFLEL